MTYLPRALEQQLDLFMPEVAAIAIEGPKGVGKTSTAEQRSQRTIRLDQQEDQALFQADPNFKRFETGTILIDEWQKLPEVWDRVRRAVDDGAGPGRFLLTGSATPVSGTDTHSGAGRILSLRMRPMALFERAGAKASISLQALMAGTADLSGSTDVALQDYATAIAESGLPGIQPLSPMVRTSQLDSYLQRVVDRELVEQGYMVRDKQSLMNWLRSYAAATATEASYNQILDGATPSESDKPSKKTTMKYREKLSEIWLLDPLPAWNFAMNPFPRISQGETHFLADPALAARLLGLSERNLLLPKNTRMLGALFEALAVLSVRVAAEANFAKVGHFRSLDGGREIDIIVETQDGGIIPIEVKLTATPNDDDVRHLLWLRDKLPDDVIDMAVITTGKHAYRRPDGVAVIPLALLCA